MNPPAQITQGQAANVAAIQGIEYTIDDSLGIPAPHHYNLAVPVSTLDVPVRWLAQTSTLKYHLTTLGNTGQHPIWLWLLIHVLHLNVLHMHAHAHAHARTRTCTHTHVHMHTHTCAHACSRLHASMHPHARLINLVPGRFSLCKYARCICPMDHRGPHNFSYKCMQSPVLELWSLLQKFKAWVGE